MLCARSAAACSICSGTAFVPGISTSTVGSGGAAILALGSRGGLLVARNSPLNDTSTRLSNRPQAVLLLTQNSFRDPLFYEPLLASLRALNHDSRYGFHAITYEQERFLIPARERPAFDSSLRAENIHHYPLRWGPGRLSRKAWEFMRAFWLSARIRLRHRPRAILALGNVAGAFGYIIGRALGMKVIIFTYEPHSEFMRDCGVWSATSLKYRLLHLMEYQMGIHADYIATGTLHMVNRLRAWGSRAKVVRIPSCVDDERFLHLPEARAQIRGRLEATGRPVFVYAGKFGDLYYNDEIATLCAKLRELIPDSYFLVLTPNPVEEVRPLFERQGLAKPQDLHVTFAEFEDMPRWLSAADMGIVAVPPLPSQRYRSPIKVGEYLACGLPYIVCRGVSEDDIWAEKHNVGVVLDSFTDDSIRRERSRIRGLLDEEPTSRRGRCREVGLAYRGKSVAVEGFAKILDEIYS